ncbi:site-specific integrase [Geodermatophilus sp. TF02-6]|uniref:site-specific integrase n=1 Tax=Geodermatophilus sp. TF02-6 TaxID=2250575 RepID=UPI000DE952C9|nr:site-specific integrase [Geodermatophilus sp. TF02-6]RBY76806.1 site-specific integrase [Geodermatophilus sp. TF02-6]
MGRPPLPLGTHGAIRCYKTGTGYRARTLARDYDGRTRAVERWGKTRAAAEAALELAVRERAHTQADEQLTADTRVAVLAEAWYSSLADLSPTTMQAYRDRLDRQILPGLGQLRIRELTVGILDRHLRLVATDHGAATTKMTRSVLSGICTLATRHDALPHNPVRDVGALAAPARSSPRALTVPELKQLRAALTYDEQAIARDLPEFIDLMMATGMRIGEAAALSWADVDLDAGTVHVRATIARITGKGLIRKSTKTDTGLRSLVLPSWGVHTLRNRAARSDRSAQGPQDAPVFPAPLGGWRDPSNTQSDLRVAFDKAGFDWVTSHVFRKSVASVMDHAGLSARAAADQLGHANTSMTTDVYFGRKVLTTGAATALEILDS